MPGHVGEGGALGGGAGSGRNGRRRGMAEAGGGGGAVIFGLYGRGDRKMSVCDSETVETESVCLDVWHAVNVCDANTCHVCRGVCALHIYVQSQSSLLFRRPKFGQILGPKLQWSVTFWPVTKKTVTSETANSTVT